MIGFGSLSGSFRSRALRATFYMSRENAEIVERNSVG
jgi:hypothetical protein